MGLWIPETCSFLLPRFALLIVTLIYRHLIDTPVLLTRRAKALSAKTGQVYVSIYDLPGSDRAKSPIQIVKTALTRPFILLFLEPICAMIAGKRDFLLLSQWLANVSLLYQSLRCGNL